MGGRHWTGREASHRGRPLLTALMLVVMVIGAVVMTSVSIVRRVLLDEDTYTSALVEADAYDRVYTEVLADPELATLTEDLLGRLRLGPEAAVQARALGTSALRSTVPPSTLRAGSETMITAVLEYIRGDRPRLEADIDVGRVLARIDDGAVVQARILLADAVDRTAESVVEYEEAVQAFAAELTSGTVPDWIPKLGGTTFDTAEVADVILEALGPRVDEELRLNIVAALLVGDERDALITAASDLITEHAESVSDRLRSDTSEGDRFEVVAALADQARQPVDSVVGSLDSARDVVRWFRPLSGVVAGLVTVVAAGVVAWIHRDDRRRAALLLAGAAIAAGMLTVVLWWFIGRAIGEPLNRAAGTEADGWRLPAGVRSVLADVRSDIGDRLTRAVLRWAALLAGSGLVVAGAAALAGRGLSWRSGALRVKRGLAIAGAVAVAAGAGVVLTALGGSDDIRACNGHEELCDRPYDEVVYAATHNSMSSPDVVKVWPEHDGDMRAQLDAGVRALLIDTHYWRELPSAARLVEGDPLLPLPVAEALYDVVEPLSAGREGTFLCHNHCVFGAMPFVDGLVMVREFLEENPDDVVTLIIQDAITPADTAEAMREAEVDSFLHVHAPDDEWPTLSELIDRGERLVVFAEEEGPPPDWYMNAFEAMQETPFLFRSSEEFSCEPNRGIADTTLFQMNHWVQRIAPDRVDSMEVNELDVLVGRARECEAERGLLPNYLAVNFYDIGDLMEAVDVLNGVS